ncbi:MAG: serine/threonine-protein kinase [Kofleriaceae bacterium]
MNKIGTGGMGAVYLAEHPQIGKKVALKVIHRELASNREVVQRFFQEAKAVNRIGNEHIVEIHDFGVSPEGDHYYIMEYLEGSNLASTLGHESVLDVRRALHIGAQIASALAAAHAAGVIHRDLKPDNVMLTSRLGDPDFVKLLDFGLAKMFAADHASAVKTAAGVLLGTPQYMSPEACESRQTLDHRTDIYALGVLLFQMVTGVLPFDGESMGEILVKQVTQLPPPPRQYNPNIPPSVEQILLRCLMKQPDARFPTMTALREALLDPENYLHRSPPMAPARSLAPGEIKVDAKTVMAYAAQQQQTRIGMAGELPLVAPPSLAGAGTQQPTIMSDGTLVPPRSARGPDMAVPGMLKSNTMRIATPLGYSSQRPRRVWPIVVVVALLLGLGGGGFAVAWYGKSAPAVAAVADAAPPPVAHGAGRAGIEHAVAPVAPIDAPRAPVADAAAIVTAIRPDAAGPVAAPVEMATVEIDTAPSGAEIIGPDHEVLGTTPAKLTLPIGTTPLTVVLHLAGYQRKAKQFTVTENLVLEVPLERLAQVNTTHHGDPGGHGSAKRRSSDDLERP